MLTQEQPRITRWSTDGVPAAQRFECFADVLSAAIVPMHVEERGSEPFDASMRILQLDSVAVLNLTGSAHRSFNSQRDLAGSRGRSYNLILSRACDCTISHRGRVALRPGDAMLTDSRFTHDLEIPEAFDFVDVQMTDEWLERWVPDPTVLTGLRLAGDGGWSAALTSFTGCLTPEALASRALPAGVLLDQLGSLLALAARVRGGAGADPAETKLRGRIEDCMLQRCSEPMLCASDVAQSLDLPPEVLHRSFLASGVTFAGMLEGMRARIAGRMLGSAMFANVAVEEVARRAGFGSTAAMRLAIRRCSGRAPSSRRCPTWPWPGSGRCAPHA